MKGKFQAELIRQNEAETQEHEEENTETMWCNWKNKVIAAARTAIPMKEMKKRKPWMNEEICITDDGRKKENKKSIRT